MKLCLGCMEQYIDSVNICPHCGYVEGTPPKEAYHLEPGTVIRKQYLIGKVLGYGGFGITYMGFDSFLNRKVAIKEYLPGEFSTRMLGQTHLTVYGNESAEQFSLGLKSFVDEAKRLAKFNYIDGVVDIYDSFMENNTGYIIMEFLDGKTSKELLKERGGKIPYEEAYDIILPIVRTLKEVHKVGIVHRDISPDNIFITKDGKIKLLDFGASRYATSLHSKSLSVILKPGYAPEEQYRSRGNQGPWSDIYAVGATFYKMLTGITPEESMERAMHDTLVEPSKLGIALPKSSENAILNALNVKIEERTQSAEQFESELTSDSAARIKATKTVVETGRFPLWLKIGIPSFALVAIVSVMIALLTNQSIVDGFVPLNAPGVVNKTVDEAEGLVTQAGFTLSVKGGEYTDKTEINKIMSQTPISGRPISLGDTIDVVISYGTKEASVPDVMNKLIFASKSALEELGFVVEIVEEYNEDFAKDVVISQSVEPETFYAVGNKIVLTVSLGSENAVISDEEVDIPDLMGLSFDEAKAMLSEIGVSVVQGEDRFEGETNKDRVVYQSALPGEKVKVGSTIEISINKGIQQVIIPSDLKASDEATAKSRLEAMSLLVVVNYEYNNSFKKGQVISHTPEAQTSVDINSTITLVVSLGANEGQPTNKPSQTPTPTPTKTPTPTPTPTPKPSSTPTPTATPTATPTPTPTPTATPTPTPTPTPPSIISVSFENSLINITEGDTVSLSSSVTFIPSNVQDKSLTWKSLNPEIASVDSSGRVTGLSKGNAAIIATAVTGTSTICNVSVSAKEIPVTKLELIVQDNVMYVGDQITLFAFVYPENATDQSLLWYSSDPSVATVTSSGYVTGVSEGKATITVTSVKANISKSCTINVR